MKPNSYIFTNFLLITVKAKDCSSHADCVSIASTSCVKDPVDNRLRCLCGDNKPPINGLCKSQLKGKFIKFFVNWQNAIK